MSVPNYKDGSIVNLMSSIEESFGASSQYKNLHLLKSEELKRYKKIILLVIDGLGYEQLQREKDSFLLKQTKGKMTSVFPSTTATAMTSYLTGSAPEEHAMTGWFMYLKELGLVSTILPYVSRASRSFDLSSILPLKEIMNTKAFSSKIRVKSSVLYPQTISHSHYSQHVFEKAKVVSYSSLNDCFSKLKKESKDKTRPYTFTYIPDIDETCHEYGTKSRKVKSLFEYLDKQIENFSKILDEETLLIISADHGHIDTPKSKSINFNKDKEVMECLSLALCGEPRAGYAYVYPSKTKQFEKLMKKKYKYALECHKSETLVKKGYFGLNKEVSEKLKERIGDYILLAKEDYSFASFLEHEKEEFDKSHHGGLSKEEMFVPLILIRKS